MKSRINKNMIIISIIILVILISMVFYLNNEKVEKLSGTKIQQSYKISTIIEREVGTNVNAKFNNETGDLTISSTSSRPGSINVTDLDNFYEEVEKVNIRTITFSNKVLVEGTNGKRLFKGLYLLTAINNISNLDVSNATTLEDMFNYCKNLTDLDLSSFDTSNVTTMSNMFNSCNKLKNLNISSFNTSNVRYMWGMFQYCHALTDLDLRNFDTSNVVNMSDMFYRCTGLKNLNVSSFNTSNVVNMSNMFYECGSLNSLNVSKFDTTNVTDMSFMFYVCKARDIDVSKFNTSNVTNMAQMFKYSGATSLDLSNFDMTNATYTNTMLENCNGLNEIYTPKICGDIKLPYTYYNAENMNDNTEYTNLTRTTFNKPTRIIRGFTITYNKNGGTINEQEITNYRYGVGATLPTDVTRSGYTFLGWYDNQSFNGTPVLSIPTTETGDKTYYAKWEQSAFTVTFKNGDTILNTQTVNRGQSATAPTAPTKPGYTFAGWDKDFSNVTSDLTVNAKWNPATNTVYTVEQYRQNLTLDGYDFIGSDIYEGTTGETVTAGITGIEGLFVDENNTNNKLAGVVAADGSLVLKVYYDRSIYQVTLNTNGGTIVEGEEVTSYTYGVGATLPSPTKVGYTFAGWYKTEDLTGEAIHTIGTEATGDKEYFAKWEEGTGTAYTVEHYKENLQGTYDKVEEDTQHLTGTTGQSVTVTPNTYEGFTIKEDNILTGTILADGSLVLKVYYDRNIYKITYNPNYSVPGGVAEPVPLIREFKYGESVQIANIYVTRTGYEFIGWNTETSGNGTNYQVGDTYSKNESTTLYAQWRANTYNVTLETNGGTIAEGEEVTSYTYGVGATLPSPTKVGYTFAGWYTNEELEGEAIAQITTTDIGDKEYFAKWEEGEGIVYKVEHYKQNIETNTYEKVATDDLTAKTGLTVTAKPKTYEGYHENTSHTERVASGEVAADGSLVLKLYYDVNKYTVTFKDSDQIVKEETVAHGEDATAPELTKDKYVLRWDKEFNNVTNNLTVDAVWLKDTDGDGIPDIEDDDTQVEYKVKHYKQIGNTNEYKLEETEELTGHLGSQVTAVAKIYEGYVENVSVKERIPTGEIVEDGSLELRLFYDTIKYTVTFVSEGQILSTQTVVYGQAAVAPETPTKEGYTFAGWDKDFSKVTSNLTVNAKWNKNQEEAPKQVGYKVEHYKQNIKTNTYEKVATEELTGTKGSNVTAVAKTYEGFHENTSHKERVARGEVAEDGSLVLKLYYDINQYKVTFKDGDKVVKEETVTHGGNATPPTITKPGYILSWDKGTDKVTGNTTFTAVWTKDPNYVDPNANDGKEEKPSFLPQTGESYMVIGTMSVLMSVAILVYLKYRKLNNM